MPGAASKASSEFLKVQKALHRAAQVCKSPGVICSVLLCRPCTVGRTKHGACPVEWD